MVVYNIILYSNAAVIIGCLAMSVCVWVGESKGRREANHTTSVQHVTEVLTAKELSGIIIAHTLRRQSPVRSGHTVQ